MTGTHYAQFCALARAAEILGERWSLLIIRELLLGPKRFGDLSDRLDNVSPTVLTARLTTLTEFGVVQKTTLPPPFNAQVYELTPVGLALKPAIRELIRWGGHFLFPMRPDDEFEPDWVLLALDAITLRTATPAHCIGLRVTHKTKSASFLVQGGATGTTITVGDKPDAPTIAARFDILLQIIAGAMPLDQAISSKLATVTGPLKIAETLPRMFDLAERRKKMPR